METLFSQTSAQFGLAVGLLIVAVIVMWRMLVAQSKDALATRDKRIEELEIERDLYRDRWVETLGAAEVGDELAKRALKGKRRMGGS